MNKPTTFQGLNHVLKELVSRIQTILETSFIGAYLQGSFAVGDYDQHSDVDFIVAIENELSSQQVDALQVMHGQVYDLGSEWAKHLEGSYFPKEILKDYTKSGSDLWYLDHGARDLIRSDHCNTILVRWIIREQGVILAGPAPMTLVDTIPQDTLKKDIFDTLNYWGEFILNNPDTYSNRFYQGYLVLNYSRMLHDLIRGCPGSKREGAEWAKSNLDPSWSDLIDTAWDCRPDPAMQVREPADPRAYEQTLNFIKYVMQESQRYSPNN